MDGQERAHALKSFAAGGPGRKVLILSDVGSRGLDLPRAQIVIQMHPPTGWQQYAHRAGRVGRMGKPGKVVTLVTPGERRGLEAISRRLGLQLREQRRHKRLMT
jgi:ATP-dependent RNA helicase DeaD